MAFCAQCGARVPDGAANCPACGAAAEPEQYTQPIQPARRSDNQPPRHTNTQQTRYRDPQQSRYSDNQPPRRQDSQQTTREYSETSERPASRPAANMCLAENEKVVRQYQCTDIRHPKAAGYLAVTNKRVIFYGKGSSSRVVKEVVLDSVSGIDCFYGMDIQVGKLIFGVILTIFGFILLSALEEVFDVNGAPALLLSLIGAIMIALSFQKCFYLSIFSSKANGSPISIGGQPRSVIGNGALYSLSSRPTQDTDRMLSELGALIQDLQTMGDHAIDKWKNKK